LRTRVNFSGAITYAKYTSFETKKALLLQKRDSIIASSSLSLSPLHCFLRQNQRVPVDSPPLHRIAAISTTTAVIVLVATVVLKSCCCCCFYRMPKRAPVTFSAFAFLPPLQPHEKERESGCQQSEHTHEHDNDERCIVWGSDREERKGARETMTPQCIHR